MNFQLLRNEDVADYLIDKVDLQGVTSSVKILNACPLIEENGKNPDLVRSESLTRKLT